MAPSNSPRSSSAASEIERTLELLQKGQKEIILDPRYRNLTMVLGITGAGKSTFVQWLAGDNTKLISEKVPGSFSDYIIKDETRISNSTTQSMTIYPELVVDPVTDFAYYDCPGFSDTRNASIDIAGTYFIKSVADYAENVRMIFTVGHDAVRVGNDRLTFPTLLKHSTNLVKNVDKFRNSIALVVTKVANNAQQDENGNWVTESDEHVINAIAEYLKLTKNEQERSQNANPNYSKFIDALLEKDGQAYTKIAIFRRPNKPGPLSEIRLLQEGKAKLVEIVKQLQLTPIEENDFGYTISAESKNTVHELVTAINERVWKEADTIGKGVIAFYQQTVDSIRAKLDSFVSSTLSVDANLEEAKTFAAKLKVADRIASELSVSDVTKKVLAEKLNYTLNVLEIGTLSENVERISYSITQLEFLQNVTDKALDQREWQIPLENIVNSLTASKSSATGEIVNFAGTLLTNAHSTVNVIAADLWQEKIKQMQSRDIQTLPAQLEQQVVTMQNQARPNSVEQLATAISKNVELLNLETVAIQSNTLALFNSAKYLSYLQALSEQPLDTWSPELLSPVESTVKAFSDSLEWYRFLNGLYSKLGEYQFQQDLSRFNVANLNEWGQAQNHQGGIQIGEQNVKQFLDITSQYNIAGHEAIKDIQVAQWQLNELNQVLSLTLRHDKARLDCSEREKLTITGDYVKFSDLKQKLAEQCPGSVSSVNIFALKTVFVDSDLDGVGDKLKFALIAPKVEVIGKRRINLDGSAGKLPIPPKAKDGEGRGAVGQVGKPGQPGGSSGSFLGITQLIVNRQDLTITANGGVGGAGQEGGNGSTGEDGVDAPAPDKQCSGFHHFKYTMDYQFERNQDFATGYYYSVRVYGKSAKDGGSGGDGGAGGKGGKPGQIQLFNLDESTEQQQIETHLGRAGSAGFGGRGGFNGRHGDDMIAGCENWKDGFGLDKWKNQSPVKRVVHNIMRQAQSGRDGAIVDGITDPEDATKIEHPGDIINEYKKFLRGNLNGVNDRFKRNTTIALIDQIDEQTSGLYDSLALMGELESLEKESRTTTVSKHNSIHFYKSLSSRITSYVASPRPTETTDDYKLLFNYLSAATLGKLYNLQSGESANLIIDVEGYLKYVQENMNSLNQLKKEHNEHEVVQQHKKKYHENIEQQIEEAKHFIETQIMPEFDKIGKEIDAKIDRLIRDVAEMAKNAEANKEALIKQREKLQKQLVLRSVFSAISVVSKVATFAGPHCAAIGTVAGGVSSLAEGFLLDGSGADVKEFEMPPGIKNNIKYVEKEYKSFFSDRAEQLKVKLTLMVEEIRSEPELSDLEADLDSISQRIPSEPSDSDTESYFSAVDELEREASVKLDAVKQSGKLSERAEQVYKRANQIIALGGVALDRYNKHRGDQAKIDATDSAIKGVEGKLKQIENYKKAITNTMAPDMHKLMGSINEINRGLDNKSLVALDIQQWKAQGMLKNLKLEIQKFIKGQEVEADMMRCFEKLDEAMSVNIKIYDRIQNFQQQQQLTDFIANINSPTANTIQIGDPEIALAVNKLDILIRSNAVLQEFDSTVTALKQMVFPYARHYLQQLQMPAQLSFNDTYIDEMVGSANAALDKMRTRVIENKTTISKVDKNTHSFDFDSARPCIQAPFYKWSSEQHSAVLGQLLSGEVVALKADIRHSDPEKDAIKFLKVMLNFKAKDSTLQPEIDSKLEKFKISANHTGNSYYRYGGKYYMINHEPLNIEYSFAKRADGRPIQSSIPFDKIQEGTLTLSPYAMWNIQLTKMNQTVSFDQLARYKDAVDLELVGPGRFIKSQDTANDDLLIEQFYSEYVDDDDAETDVEEQYENEQVYSAMVMNQVQCRQFMAMRSNSIHRSGDRLANQANAPLSYMSRLGQTVSNYFGGRSSATAPNTNIAHPRFEYTRQQQQHNANTNSLNAASNSVDVHGNLLMGQLLVGLIAGKNGSLSSESYSSPEQTRAVQVDRLAQRVVPALSSPTRFRSNQLHNFNNQWHLAWNDTRRN